MGRLREFASVVTVLGNRKIDEMQAAVDDRREARARSGGDRDGAARESRPRPEAHRNLAREAG